MSNKSAKDLAFDRERVKYRHQINDLKSELHQRDISLFEANKRVSNAESRCDELQDWVIRLLECMDMSEEELVGLIQRDKNLKSLGGMLASLSGQLIL